MMSLSNVYIFYLIIQFILCSSVFFEKQFDNKLIEKATNVTNIQLDEIIKEWDVEKYPYFITSCTNHHKTWVELLFRFTQTIVEFNLWTSSQKEYREFSISFLGNSYHDNQSVNTNKVTPSLLEAYLQPVFKSLNMNLRINNLMVYHTNAGTTNDVSHCVPYDLCLGTIAGLEVDMIVLEQTIECQNLINIEQLIRQSNQLDKKPIVVLSDGYQMQWGRHRGDQKYGKRIGMNSNVLNDKYVNGSVNPHYPPLSMKSFDGDGVGIQGSAKNSTGHTTTSDENELREILYEIHNHTSSTQHRKNSLLDKERTSAAVNKLFSWKKSEEASEWLGKIHQILLAYPNVGIQIFSHDSYKKYVGMGPYIPEQGTEVDVRLEEDLGFELGQQLKAAHYAYFWLLAIRESLHVLSKELSLHSKEGKELMVLMELKKALDKKRELNAFKYALPVETVSPTTIPGRIVCYTDIFPALGTGHSISDMVLRPSSRGKDFLTELTSSTPSVIDVQYVQGDILTTELCEGHNHGTHATYPQQSRCKQWHSIATNQIRMINISRNSHPSGPDTPMWLQSNFNFVVYGNIDAGPLSLRIPRNRNRAQAYASDKQHLGSIYICEHTPASNAHANSIAWGSLMDDIVSIYWTPNVDADRQDGFQFAQDTAQLMKLMQTAHSSCFQVVPNGESPSNHQIDMQSSASVLTIIPQSHLTIAISQILIS